MAALQPCCSAAESPSGWARSPAAGSPGSGSFYADTLTAAIETLTDGPYIAGSRGTQRHRRGTQGASRCSERMNRHLAMIFPSRSQLASKQITRTGRAEAVTKEGLAATLLPARQPDQMGQRHPLRPVRPQTCAFSSALRTSTSRSWPFSTMPVRSSWPWIDSSKCRSLPGRGAACGALTNYWTR